MKIKQETIVKVSHVTTIELDEEQWFEWERWEGSVLVVQRVVLHTTGRATLWGRKRLKSGKLGKDQFDARVWAREKDGLPAWLLSERTAHEHRVEEAEKAYAYEHVHEETR